MIGWLQLANEQRKAVIDEAEQISGISAKAIEKDWWVTLSLKALFQSKYRSFLVFKGGTSLSKGWNLIARFSEDIDLALDSKAFDLDYIENPTKGYVERLKRKGCQFTSNELREELHTQILNIGVPENTLTIVAAPIPQNRPDTDPQTLFVRYTSLYPSNKYIADEVKIEVSVRSLRMPFTTVLLESLLHKINPRPVYHEIPFSVETVEAHKTFLEKIFLLHEEFQKPDKNKIKSQRMSRHLYDLFKMAKTNIETSALADHALYNDLIKHREQYIRLSQFDYNSLAHSTISFLPSDEILEDYKKDYATMQEQMIYEEAVSFEELISQLKLLQGRVRFKYTTRNLNEIIELAQNEIFDLPSFENASNGSIFEKKIFQMANQNEPESAENKTVIYTVKFIYQKNELNFENISLDIKS